MRIGVSRSSGGGNAPCKACGGEEAGSSVGALDEEPDSVASCMYHGFMMVPDGICLCRRRPVKLFMLCLCESSQEKREAREYP